MFNCGAARFNHTSWDSGLGPDHYRPREIGKKYNSVLKVAGSAAFKASKRPQPFVALSMDANTIGPGDYTGEQITSTIARRIKEKQINKDNKM